MGQVLFKCCKTCGYVTYYKTSKRFECAGKEVKMNGICDRYQKNTTPADIMRRIDKKLKELDKYETGQFQLTERPEFLTNYHEVVLGGK